ncbi:hypothetical protein SCAR479_06108 [Seiridium cardinale]|uniref:Uncharacterized protein n=1 Tax=Seiridium cardinale TaxID=138064 RepID=A0ABR2XU96_9PEZI
MSSKRQWASSGAGVEWNKYYLGMKISTLAWVVYRWVVAQSADLIDDVVTGHMLLVRISLDDPIPSEGHYWEREAV